MLTIIPGALAVATLVLFVKEKVDAKPIGKPFAFSLKQFNGNFLAYLAIVMLFTLGNSSDAFLLFRVQETIDKSGTLYAIVTGLPVFGDVVRAFGDAAAQKKMVDILFLPLVWSFFHVIKVAFSTPLGALSDRIGRKLVINIGWGIYALVYACFALLDKLPGAAQVFATFVLFAVYALYYAFSEGAEKAFVADVTTGEQRGSAFGMYNFAIGLGALPASIIFGLLYKAFGAPVAFGMGAAIACAAMVLLAVVVRERPAGNSK
jgi:MFS family permease